MDLSNGKAVSELSGHAVAETPSVVARALLYIVRASLSLLLHPIIQDILPYLSSSSSHPKEILTPSHFYSMNTTNSSPLCQLIRVPSRSCRSVTACLLPDLDLGLDSIPLHYPTAENCSLHLRSSS